MHQRPTYATYTGRLGTFVSDPIAAEKVALWLVTDQSVREFGYKVSGYSWR
jgi:hypothetical protein